MSTYTHTHTEASASQVSTSSDLIVAVCRHVCWNGHVPEHWHTCAGQSQHLGTTSLHEWTCSESLVNTNLKVCYTFRSLMSGYRRGWQSWTIVFHLPPGCLSGLHKINRRGQIHRYVSPLNTHMSPCVAEEHTCSGLDGLCRVIYEPPGTCQYLWKLNPLMTLYTAAQSLPWRLVSGFKYPGTASYKSSIYRKLADIRN